MAFNVNDYGPRLIKQYLALAKACLAQGQQQGGAGFNVKAQINAALYQLSQALKWHVVLLMPQEQRDRLMEAECPLVIRNFIASIEKENSSHNVGELYQLLANASSWLSELNSLIETLALPPAVFIGQQSETPHQNVIASSNVKKMHWTQQPIDYYFSAYTALSELINRHNESAVEN